MGIRCADHVTPLYPQKLALTSPTGGGRSVGIVRSRTKATEFSLYECLLYYPRAWYSPGFASNRILHKLQGVKNLQTFERINLLLSNIIPHYTVGELLLSTAIDLYKLKSITAD